MHAERDWRRNLCQMSLAVCPIEARGPSKLKPLKRLGGDEGPSLKVRILSICPMSGRLGKLGTAQVAVQISFKTRGHAS